MNEDKIDFLRGLSDEDIYRDKIDNRGLKQYINMLFRDESKTRRPEKVFEIKLLGDNLKLEQHEFKQALFGGLRSFFRTGKKILDLGSGVGKATKELNDLFSNSGIDIIGIDVNIPEVKSDIVGADFMNLPFKNNSIDRIMALETFPRWYGDYPTSMRASTKHFFNPESTIYILGDDGLLDINKVSYLKRLEHTWNEINRVAAPGCIFRGTVQTCNSEADYLRIMSRFKPLLQKGWKVIFYSEKNPQFTNFIAYLPVKDADSLQK